MEYGIAGMADPNVYPKPPLSTSDCRHPTVSSALAMAIACPSPRSMTMMRVLLGLTSFKFATVAAVTWAATWSALRMLQHQH